MAEMYAEVTFHLRADLDQEALFQKAREIDEGEEPEEGYSFAQAVQVVWHLEPEWLHEHVLEGWTMDRATDEAGYMRDIWPELH